MPRKGSINVTTQPTLIRPANLVNPSVYQLGFWTASFTALTAVVALGAAVTTPPRSGPFCTLAMTDVCVTYPYTAVAAYVPRDYIWMVPALLMVLLFLPLVACLHYAAAVEKKVFSQIALSFATIAVAAHPGTANTELTRHLPPFLRPADRLLMPLVVQSAAMGALPTLRAATDPEVTGGQYYGPSGIGEQRGYPKLVEASKHAHEVELQQRLWAVSEELTGITFPV